MQDWKKNNLKNERKKNNIITNNTESAQKIKLMCHIPNQFISIDYKIEVPHFIFISGY